MKLIDLKILDSLTTQANNAPRKRAHYNLHSDLNDPIHKLCIAVEQGSYVRPHRHLIPSPKWELLTILRGKISVLTFDKTGEVTGRYDLESRGALKALEIPSDIFHTFVSMENGTIVMEVKPGPYIYPDENDFSTWAPKEGEVGAVDVELWYRTAKTGEKFKNQNCE